MPGGHVAISLITSNGIRVGGELQNVSRGSAAMVCRATIDVGTGVEVQIAGMDEAMLAKIERSSGGITGFTFHQDAASIGRVDRAIETVRAAVPNVQPGMSAAA
jgi:hypothetical protein